jgi:hypothetical protein
MGLKKLKELLENNMSEEISTKGTPTRDALDKSAVGLFRKAYYDYRDHRTEKNKYYLRGVQDSLMVALGEIKFNIMKPRIVREYTKNKII